MGDLRCYAMCVLHVSMQGIYVTYVYEGGPAYHAGLHVHDKLLQV